MSKLLRRAKARYKFACESFKLISVDDAYLDTCCFDLQQSLEFTLKYIVECSGKPYSFGHSILTQLIDLEQLGVKVPNAEFYEINAPVIESWETQSRYQDNFTATRRLVHEVMDSMPKLFEFADSLTEPISSNNQNEMNAFK